ncbi:WGxxGxxG family protein [Cohnella sp.]|uniref:WGxxGxxG family protein n=1 Tax=Cohnella sp. TaxID=1883426 RepID=UPI003564C68C
MAASLALSTCIALASTVPAFAEQTNGTAGTTGMAGDSRTLNGAHPARTFFPNAGRTDGTVFDRQNDGTFGTYGANGFGAYDTNRMNAYRPDNATNTTNMTTRANNTVRRMDAAPRTGFSWGWLGLLGLFGLAGMRSRSREDAR